MSADPGKFNPRTKAEALTAVERMFALNKERGYLSTRYLAKKMKAVAPTYFSGDDLAEILAKIDKEAAR